ncbi:MAG: hypothetical protein ACRD0J_16570 [Acidimicrobiales bacterium]
MTAGLLVLPMAGLATLTLAFGTGGVAYAQTQAAYQGQVTSNTYSASAGSGAAPSNSGAPYDPLAYDCTHPSSGPSGCDNVGLTHGYYGNHVVDFLYTANFYCDHSVTSHAATGCEAGKTYSHLPPGATSQDTLYIPVPLGFAPTQGLQCPMSGNCIDHPHTIDLSALYPVLKQFPALHLTSASQLDNAPLTPHSHVIYNRNNNLPEWWNVVVVPVTSQAGFNTVISTTSEAQLKADLGKGGVYTSTVATNAFLYFQVTRGTSTTTAAAAMNQNVYNGAGGPAGLSSSQLYDPLNIATTPPGSTTPVQTKNCSAVPGGPVPPPCNADGVGLTKGFYNGHTVNFLYSQNFYCDKTVSSHATNGCEAGAKWNKLPPGTPSANYTDPLYIITPLFKPGPSGLQCPTQGYCIDHPTHLDLSRLYSTLKPLLGLTSASQLYNTPLTPHSHIVLTPNNNQPEWWPVNVIGVTSQAAYAQIVNSPNEYATAQALAGQGKGVTKAIPTNAFLWFQVLPGQGAVTPVPTPTPTPTPTPAPTSNTCMTHLPSGTVVGGASTPGGGYVEVDSAGDVAVFGSAKCYGSLTGVHLNAPIVGMTMDPATGGYWLVASDGGVFSFNAAFHGSAGNIPLAAPVVGIASTADGGGYTLAAKDGGVFTYGDAAFHGSAGNIPLVAPVVGISADQATGGYWLVASDGGVFSYGAPFHGSAGAINLAKPVVGMKSVSKGTGYRLVASDGGVFDYGSATFHGSAGNINLAQPVVGIINHKASGYWLVASDGGIFSYNAPFYGSAA